MKKDKKIQEIENRVKENIAIKEKKERKEEIKIPPKQVKFLKFEHGGLLDSDGTNNIVELNNFNDRSQKKGIAISNSDWVTFELEREVEFHEIEIGCFSHPNFGASKLNDATVLTSKDKTNWTKVGTVGNNTSHISRVSLIKTSAKFIKIDKNYSLFEYSYLGIGYIKIINLN